MINLSNLQTTNITTLAERKCRICNEVKLVSEFHKNGQGPLSYRTECKTCRSALRSEYDYIRDRFRKYKERNGGIVHFTDDLILRVRTATHCQYCGDEFVNERGHKKQATLDHIYASDANLEINTALVCRSDNAKKGTQHIYDYYQSSDSFTDELWSEFLKEWLGRLYGEEITDDDIPHLTEQLRQESLEYKAVAANE